MDRNLEAAVDACIIGTGLEFDIARVGYIILKKEGFVYEEGTGTKRGQWKTPAGDYDPKLINIKNAYKTIVVDAFLTRSIYWNNYKEDTFDGQYKSMALSQICLRISREPFLKKLIAETQNFYHD